MKLRLSSPGKFRLRAAGAVALVGALTDQAGTGVTIDEYPDYTFGQRDDTDSYTFTFTGTCAGNPTRIEYRMVDWYTGIPRTDWATLIDNPPPTWSVNKAISRGGWDLMQIRDGVDHAIVDATINRIGVGIAIVLYGQSNMHLRPGLGSTGAKRPLGDKRAMFLNASNVLERVGNINDARAANLESDQVGYTTGGGYIQDTSKAGDGFVYIGNLTAQALNCPVVLIERAVGGMTIAELSKPTTHWNNLVAAINAAGGDFEIALMHQGESDANTQSVAQMITAYTNFYGNLLTVNGRTSANCSLFMIGLGPGAYTGSSEGEFGNMRQAHRVVAEIVAGIEYYSSGHSGYTGDGVHMTAGSISLLDRRGIQTVLATHFGIGTSCAGPRAVSAARSGLNVDIQLAHAGGTALMDGAGGTGTALTGFQIYDDGAGGAEIAVASTGFPTTSSIRLVMATTPTGPLRVSYAMMNNPHNTGNVATGVPIAASIPCDNATGYHNSAGIGCVLQPFAAINVT